MGGGSERSVWANDAYMLASFGWKCSVKNLCCVLVGFMTITYFMARSAEVTYPRSQMSVYRTIGPLVYKSYNIG